MTTGRRRTTADDEIDRNLKRAFDELRDAPLPDRFTDLIERLRSGTPPPPKPADDTSD